MKIPKGHWEAIRESEKEIAIHGELNGNPVLIATVTASDDLPEAEAAAIASLIADLPQIVLLLRQVKPIADQYGGGTPFERSSLEQARRILNKHR